MTDLEGQAREFFGTIPVTHPLFGDLVTTSRAVAFARRVRAEALAQRLSADDVTAAINAARKEARAEALREALESCGRGPCNGIRALAAEGGARAVTALPTPEEVAAFFHETYERLAPQFGYETREATAVPWEDVPADNRALMIAVADALLARLRPGWERMEHRLAELEKDWPTDADAFRVQAGICTRLLAECDALRADLRACAEALAFTKDHDAVDGLPCWCSRWPGEMRVTGEDGGHGVTCRTARAALARPGVQAELAPAPVSPPSA